MLIQGDPLDERRFIEKIRSDALSFIRGCNPRYSLVIKTILSTAHLKQLRKRRKHWINIIDECKKRAPGELRNASRESGACYTMRCYCPNETLVISFNPFAEIAISFIQDTAGFRLDTSTYSEFEKEIVAKCAEKFGGCDLLPKEYYATRLHDFGDTSVLDLAFESESLVYQACYLDRDEYTSSPVLTGEEVDRIPTVKKLAIFIRSYSETLKEFSVDYDVEYFEDKLLDFKAKWQEFRKSKPNYIFVSLDDRNGYLACSRPQQGEQLCIAVSPYLPYWMPFYRRTSLDKVEYIEAGRGESINGVASWINYFFNGYEQISLKQADRGLKNLHEITVASVLFGEFVGKRIRDHR